MTPSDGDAGCTASDPAARKHSAKGRNRANRLRRGMEYLRCCLKAGIYWKASKKHEGGRFKEEGQDPPAAERCPSQPLFANGMSGGFNPPRLPSFLRYSNFVLVKERFRQSKASVAVSFGCRRRRDARVTP